MRENRTSGSESGDWKRDRGAGLRPEAKATETPPDPIVNAPVLDSTQVAEHNVEKCLSLTSTGLGCAQRPDSQSASRAAASGPINPVPWVAAHFPCDSAPVHRAGGNRMGPAQAEPGRLCRSTRVEEMGEALPVLCGRDARAPGWASSHDAGISRSRYRRCIRAPLVIEGAPSLFVFIRVHWWFVFKNDRLFHPRMIRPVVGGGGGTCLRPSTREDCCRRLRGSTLTPSFPWAHAHGYVLPPLRGSFGTPGGPPGDCHLKIPVPRQCRD